MTARIGVIFLMLVEATLRAQPPMVFEKVECCGSRFDFAEVLKFAVASQWDSKGFKVGVKRIIPTGRNIYFSIGGSSGGETIENCFWTGRHIQEKVSHAYLFETQAGRALHYWDHATRTYRHEVISGIDLFAADSQQFRIAWLDPFTPSIWIVIDLPLSKERALAAGSSAMKSLGLVTAEVIVRTDPYHFSDWCFPYSIPLQWRDFGKDILPTISDETAICRVVAGTCNFHRARRATIPVR